MLTAPSSDRDPQTLTSGGAGTPSPGPGPASAPVSGHAGGAGGPLARAALDGRRIGLICLSRHGAAAALFIEAAEGLGAQVSVLHAADVVDAGTDQQDKLVRMLSRLYDVIECQDLPPATVRRISELVAVPVLANLGGSALRAADVPVPVRGDVQAWEQGLAKVRQALLRAL